jgi:hypothetical protein
MQAFEKPQYFLGLFSHLRNGSAPRRRSIAHGLDAHPPCGSHFGFRRRCSCAPSLAYGRPAPRDVTLQVAGDGAVEIRCTNGSERYARTRVLHTAAGFLRSIDQNVPALSIPATLTPTNGERPIRHMITIGACVSIARTDEALTVFSGPQRAALPRAHARARAATAA